MNEAAGQPTLLFPGDLRQYWSAGRVHLAGGDPYDGGQMLAVQRLMTGDPGRSDVSSLWNPPWTLPVYWPLAALPPFEAQLVWWAVQVAATLLGGWLVWRVYGGRTVWLPALVVALFGPVWWMVWAGQNTGLIVLGLGGFLWLRAAGRPGLAGVVGALAAVKPHLLAAVAAAAVVDAVISRAGRRTLVGGLAVVAVGSGLAVLPRPDVFARYADAMSRPPTPGVVPVSHWQTPTAGYFLREAVAGEYRRVDPAAGFAIQFVPTVLAVLAAAGWRVARGRRWDWPTAFPALVGLSVVAAPYGAWLFDLTVLLVPVLAALAGRADWGRPLPVAFALAGLFALSVATLVQAANGYPDLHQYVWLAPAVLLWCLAVDRIGRAVPSDDSGAGI